MILNHMKWFRNGPESNPSNALVHFRKSGRHPIPCLSTSCCPCCQGLSFSLLHGWVGRCWLRNDVFSEDQRTKTSGDSPKLSEAKLKIIGSIHGWAWANLAQWLRICYRSLCLKYMFAQLHQNRMVKKLKNAHVIYGIYVSWGLNSWPTTTWIGLDTLLCMLLTCAPSFWWLNVVETDQNMFNPAI